MTLKIRKLIPDCTSDGKAHAVDYKPGQDFGTGQVGDNQVAESQSNFSHYESNIRRNMAPRAASLVPDNPIYSIDLPCYTEGVTAKRCRRRRNPPAMTRPDPNKIKLAGSGSTPDTP